MKQIHFAQCVELVLVMRVRSQIGKKLVYLCLSTFGSTMKRYLLLALEIGLVLFVVGFVQPCYLFIEKNFVHNKLSRIAITYFCILK